MRAGCGRNGGMEVQGGARPNHLISKLSTCPVSQPFSLPCPIANLPTELPQAPTSGADDHR